MSERNPTHRRGRVVSTFLLTGAILCGTTTDTRAGDVIERQVTEELLDASDVTVMTANVHGFEHYTNRRVSNVPILFQAIHEVDPDIICFQEFNPDREKRVVNQLTALGYNLIFASTVREGYEGLREGNAVATKGVIESYEAVTLPNNKEGIPRQVLSVTIATNLGKITLANTHLGLDTAERWKQATFIENLGIERAIDCGDYNQNFLLGLSPGAGRSTTDSRALLSPHKQQSTSTVRLPTHERGSLIDRVTTDCGTLKTPVADNAELAVRNLTIGSDHLAPVGTFDLRNCFKTSP